MLARARMAESEHGGRLNKKSIRALALPSVRVTQVKSHLGSSHSRFANWHRTNQPEAVTVCIPWIPREPNFFDLLDEVVELIVKGAEVLIDLVEHWEHPERRLNELGELEHRCDRCVEKILSTLGCTLITPLDREDIHALARRLDDVLDNMEEEAFWLTALPLAQSSPQALKLALNTQRSCSHLQQALHLCRANLGSEAIAEELWELPKSRRGGGRRLGLANSDGCAGHRSSHFVSPSSFVGP